MKLRILLLLMLCAGIGTASAQSDSNGYYRFPLNLPHLFSAGFAEMRPNHFHSGIDLKTAGTEGHPLYAAADGQIVRIGLQPGGYGRVLYIAHPNGTTTVYGHMQRFTDEVEKFITEERYRLQRNTGDFYPSDGQFPVKRGEQIGLTGNSGSSGGPHVHFEVRESDSQRTLNTIAAGMVTVKDDIPPLIMKIHYIEVDSLDGVAVNSKPRTLGVRRIDPNTYQAASDTPFGVGAKGYFVIEASDRKNDVSNTFGIYRIEARIDGHPFYEYVMDGFTFDMSRYCNAVSYYPIQRNSRNEVFRLAQLDGNPFRYRTMVDRGLIRVGKDERKTVEIDVQDDCGNVSHLKFDIVGYGDDASFRAQRDSTAFKADNRRQSTATQGAVSVSIPAGALYEPIFYNIGIDEDLNTELAERSDTSVVILSDVFSVGDADVPLQKSMRLTVKGYVPENLRSRTTLASVSDKGGVWRAGGSYKDGAVSLSTRSFGKYCLAADLEAPTVTPSFTSGADLSSTGSISFRLRDNFSGISTVSLHIDGQWAILERKSSSSPVVHIFDDERFGRNKRHTVTLTVTDGVGNRTVWRGEYFR